MQFSSITFNTNLYLIDKKTLYQNVLDDVNLDIKMTVQY